MCEGTWRRTALIEPKAVRTSRLRCVDSSPMAAVEPYELQVSTLSMRPIAPDMYRIQPPMYGRRSSRGGAFSSALGMLGCPRLSAPSRLPPAPSALMLEAAWCITASLIAHSWPSFSPLLRSQSCVRSLACFSCAHHTCQYPYSSVSFAFRSPATESLLPSYFDPTSAVCYGLCFALNRVLPNV